MGFFDKVKSFWAGGLIPDPHQSDPEAAGFQEQVKAADLSGIAARLTNTWGPGQWHDRRFLVDAVAGKCYPNTLEMWCQSEPQNPVPFLLLGAQQVEEAWGIRGNGSRVSAEAQAGFKEMLGRASQTLHMAAQLAPEDPTPHGYMIRAAMGLGQDTRQHFEYAVQLDPLNYPVHQTYLVSILEKWGGSHAEAFAFAREVFARSPEGSSLPLLVVWAHTERWMYQNNFEEDAQGAITYLAQEQVQAEIQQAYSHSLGSPQFQIDRLTSTRRSETCFVFYLLRQEQLLAHELSQLGFVATEVPWAWDWQTGTYQENFKAARQRVGVK